jgi:hypothetical protein
MEDTTSRLVAMLLGYEIGLAIASLPLTDERLEVKPLLTGELLLVLELPCWTVSTVSDDTYSIPGQSPRSLEPHRIRSHLQFSHSVQNDIRPLPVCLAWNQIPVLESASSR